MTHRTKTLRFTDKTSAAVCSCGWQGGKNHDIGISRLQANDHVFNNWPAVNDGVKEAVAAEKKKK